MSRDNDDELLRLKREAVRRLRERGGEAGARVNFEVSDERVRHELDVYHIELEMQNEELQQANLELEIIKARYFTLFDASPLPLVVLDEQGRVVNCNTPASILFGITRDQNQHQHLLRVFDAESRRAFSHHVSEVFRLKARRSCDVTSQPREDELVRHLRLETTYLDARHGEPAQALLAVVDLTEQKQLQLRLATARENAEQSDRLKGQFLSLVSHEIRTPLTSIVGYVDLLRRDDPTPEQRERLELVARASRHLMGIINDVLDFSKIEADELDFHPDAFSTQEFFEYLNKLFLERARTKLIKMVFAIDALPPRLIGDKERLRQCVVNLLGNAIKFTPIGGQITVEAAYRSKNMVISVTDTGPGIPKDVQEVIFRPFRQSTDVSTRQHGGTGLGLPIAKRLIEMMGGSIYMTTELGRGTTFVLQAPLPSAGEVLMRSPAALAPSPHARRARPLDPSEEHRLLLVEDNVDLQKLMSILLERFGYAFDVASDGFEALDRLRATSYSLVLLDMQMPKLNGYDVIKAVRQDPDLRDIPVVAVTGQGLKHEVAAAFEAGCDYHLVKPFSLDQLSHIISTITGEKEDSDEASPPRAAPEANNAVPQALVKIIAQFKSRLPVRVAQLRTKVEAASSSDAPPPEVLEELVRGVHSFRGAAGTYGCFEVYDVLTQWEAELNEAYIPSHQFAFLERLQTLVEKVPE